MRFLAIFLVATLWSCGALSHHSVGGLFDQSAFVTMEVEVVEYHFIYPHPHMMAKQLDGTDQLLTLDMDNAREFDRLGLGADAFLPGDNLLVILNPSHSLSTTYYVNTIEHRRMGYRYVTNVRQLYELE